MSMVRLYLGNTPPVIVLEPRGFVRGSRGLVNANAGAPIRWTINFTDYIETNELQFTPVRSDGGATEYVLNDGSIVQRYDGWRLEHVIKWGLLTGGQLDKLAKLNNDYMNLVLNSSEAYQLMVKPHSNHNFEYEAVIKSDFAVNSVEGYAIGHTFTLNLASRQLIRSLPRGLGSITPYQSIIGL